MEITGKERGGDTDRISLIRHKSYLPCELPGVTKCFLNTPTPLLILYH